MRVDIISNSIAPQHAFSITIHLIVFDSVDAKWIQLQLTLSMSQNLDVFIDRNWPCQLVFSIQVEQAWSIVITQKQTVSDSNPPLYAPAANVDEASLTTPVDQLRFLDSDILFDTLANAINGPVIFPNWVPILALFVVGLVFLTIIVIGSVLFSRYLRWVLRFPYLVLVITQVLGLNINFSIHSLADLRLRQAMLRTLCARMSVSIPNVLMTSILMTCRTTCRARGTTKEAWTSYVTCSPKPASSMLSDWPVT